jgi:hypothetical protein
MVKFMMESGLMVSKKVMVYGREYMETPILGSGRIVRLMAMEFISGKPVLFISLS